MGMAAGQARLLSITTRMSDNELRAQLINNDKMRLATKSAQVSEAYTTALNEAQMMFTNYDADNKTSYKELTYNALTAYNPYNNQYAISNASGQVLVSETDAKNFKNANGNLNTFLASYGLEYSTDYFSSLIGTNVQTAKETKKDSDGNILVAEGDSYLEYKTGIFDDEGAEILGYITYAKKNEYNNATSLSEVLKNMYNGVDKTHPGYDATKSSLDYINYTACKADYTNAYNTMLSVVNDKMSTELQKVVGEDHATVPNKLTFAQAYETFTRGTIPSTENWKDWLYVLANIIGESGFDEDGKKIGTPTGLFVYASDKGRELLTNFQNSLIYYQGDWVENPYSSGTLTRSYDSSSSTTTLKYADAVSEVDANGDTVTENVTSLEFSQSGSSYAIKVGNNPAITGAARRDDSSKIDFTYYINSEGNAISETDYNALTDKNGYVKTQRTIDKKLFSSNVFGASDSVDVKDLTDNTGKFYYNIEITDEDRKSIGKQAVETIQGSITNIWDISIGGFEKFTDGPNGPYYKAYMDAAEKFYLEMFGGTSVPEELKKDSKSILYNMNDIEKLKKAINDKANASNATPEAKAKAESFKKIYDVYILDCVMNTYGEPKFTWIDQNNKNANGEHKAQWYTNLFNRMKTGGYKTLQDGLASSTEWIKFAFESGLVTLEQVDGSNTWNSTTYSNCSDITEQTNSTAVTTAEAEYNAQMNKIQNKDKMYDLELKNIDTEHNSLQTEYESIKGAIDKNIERTFKIYS